MQNSRDVKVKSVAKALDLLSMLIFDDPQRDGQPLSVLAGKLGLPSNTAHSLLQTLIACGYACQTKSGLYAAGEVCRQIGTMNLIFSDSMARTVGAGMRECALATKVDIVFVMLGGGKRIVAARCESGGALQINFSALETRHFYSLPTSRVLTAWATEIELRQIVTQNGFPGETWDGASSIDDMRILAAQLRQQGYVALDETTQGLFSCAVPVLRGDGHLLGALGAYVSLYNLGRERKEEVVNGLQALAQRIHEDPSI